MGTDSTNQPGSSAGDTGKMTGLIGHLLAHHHPYTKTALQQLAPLLDKVVRVHGDRHEELLELDKLFYELSGDMEMHLMKEEHILFPYMLGLESNSSAAAPHFGSIANPIRMMTMEHEHDSLILKKMQGVTDGFTPPPGACGSFTALYAGLHELVDDLLQHIDLENKQLFPLAIATERSRQS